MIKTLCLAFQAALALQVEFDLHMRKPYVQTFNSQESFEQSLQKMLADAQFDQVKLEIENFAKRDEYLTLVKVKAEADIPLVEGAKDPAGPLQPDYVFVQRKLKSLPEAIKI